MVISERALAAAPSPTLAITARVRALQAQGVDVIGFGAGEPDFNTPAPIRDAAKAALDAGITKYTASSGDPGLKGAICAKLARENGLTYTPDQVIVSCGAKHSLYNIFQAMLDPGDEVIIPAPYWVSYPEQVKLADGVPVIVETSPDADFVPTAASIRAAVTPRTKAIVLNSPSNPTGGVASQEAVAAIVKVATDTGTALISDEIYEHLLYDERTHVSPAALGPEAYERTVTVNGLSKAYAMTGWRLGYTASADRAFIAAMGRIQDQSTSNPVSFAQKGGEEALCGDQSSLEPMRRAFQARRDLIVRLLNGIDGVTCRLPGGAFYAFADVEELYGRRHARGAIGSCDDLADWLLEEARVAVVPGSGFGAPGYVRLSYATSEALIEEGVGRIAAAVKTLR